MQFPKHVAAILGGMDKREAVTATGGRGLMYDGNGARECDTHGATFNSPGARRQTVPSVAKPGKCM